MTATAYVALQADHDGQHHWRITERHALEPPRLLAYGVEPDAGTAINAAQHALHLATASDMWAQIDAPDRHLATLEDDR